METRYGVKGYGSRIHLTYSIDGGRSVHQACGARVDDSIARPFDLTFATFARINCKKCRKGSKFGKLQFDAWDNMPSFLRWITPVTTRTTNPNNWAGFIVDGFEPSGTTPENFTRETGIEIRELIIIKKNGYDECSLCGGLVNSDSEWEGEAPSGRGLYTVTYSCPYCGRHRKVREYEGGGRLIPKAEKPSRLGCASDGRSTVISELFSDGSRAYSIQVMVRGLDKPIHIHADDLTHAYKIYHTLKTAVDITD